MSGNYGISLSMGTVPDVEPNTYNILSPRTAFNYYKTTIEKFDTFGDTFMSTMYPKDALNYYPILNMVIFSPIKNVQIYKGGVGTNSPELMGFDWSDKSFLYTKKEGQLRFQLDILFEGKLQEIFEGQTAQKFTLRFTFDAPANPEDISVKALPDSINYIDIEITDDQGKARKIKNKLRYTSDGIFFIRFFTIPNLIYHAYALSKKREKDVSNVKSFYENLNFVYDRYYNNITLGPGDNKNILLTIFDDAIFELGEEVAKKEKFEAKIITALSLVAVAILFTEGIIIGGLIASASSVLQKAVVNSINALAKSFVKRETGITKNTALKTIKEYRSDFFAILKTIYNEYDRFTNKLLLDTREGTPEAVLLIMKSKVKSNDLIVDPQYHLKLRIEVVKQVCKLGMKIYSSKPLRLNNNSFSNGFTAFNIPDDYTTRDNVKNTNSKIKQFYEDAIELRDYSSASSPSKFRPLYFSGEAFDENNVFINVVQTNTNQAITSISYLGHRGFNAIWKIGYTFYPTNVTEDFLIKHVFSVFGKLNKYEFFIRWGIERDDH